MALLFSSALGGGGWSAPRPGRFKPRERPGAHFMAGWMGPRVGLEGCGKSTSPQRLDPWTLQPIASRYTNRAIPAP
jgi:hypothetical protein